MILLYQYKAVCPKCKIVYNFGHPANDIVAAMCNKCSKCGYNGVVDVKYLGRRKYVLQPTWKGDLINKDIISDIVCNTSRKV